jgi:hypothetical protein
MITLITTVYEKDFEHILNTDSWFFNYTNELITKKIILINNIQNLDKFNYLKEKFYNDFEFYYTEDYIDTINKTFKLNVNKNEKSYYYSVQHYCTLLLSQTNYIFYVGPDCKIYSENLINFFENSIKTMSTDDDIIVTTLFWDKLNLLEQTVKHEEATITKKNDVFFLSKIFSDQVYFISKNKGLSIDFTNENELHQFPQYGINSFEYRLTNYLITNKKYRGIIKDNSYYIHKSF